MPGTLSISLTEGEGFGKLLVSTHSRAIPLNLFPILWTVLLIWQKPVQLILRYLSYLQKTVDVANIEFYEKCTQLLGNRWSCMSLSHPFLGRLQAGYCIFITYFQGLRDLSSSKFRSVQEMKHSYLSASLVSSVAECHTIYTKPESHSVLMADSCNFMSW